FARPTGLRVHAGAGGDARERFGGEDFAGRAVDDVHVTVAIGMKENLTRGSVPRQVHQHALVDAAIVEETVWAPLICPDRVSAPGISRKNGRRPLVVPRPLPRVPGRSARGAVIDKVEQRVVGGPTPDRS